MGQITVQKNVGGIEGLCIITPAVHGLPYDRIYSMLEYKLKLAGIRFVRQEESYTSQCSPYADVVSKEVAEKSNRKERGLYLVRGEVFNADAVGAYNIMRKYFAISGIEKERFEENSIGKTKVILAKRKFAGVGKYIEELLV